MLADQLICWTLVWVGHSASCDIVLCCFVMHFTLTLPLSDQEHKQDLLNFPEKLLFGWGSG